jgi:hypothetical protein
MADEGEQSAFGQFAIGGYKMCFMRILPIDTAKIKDHSDDLNCGTRARSADDQSPSIITPGLNVLLQPTPEELAVLLPLIGFTLDTTYKWTDTALPSFNMKWDRGVAAAIRAYTGAKVDQAQFYSVKGSALILSLRIFAMTISDGATFTEAPVANNSTPFVHSQGVINLDGSARKYTRVQYSVSNRLTVEHNNSVYPTNIDAGDRIEQVSVNFPANTEHEDLIAEGWGATRADGIAGDLQFTRGGKSVLFDWDVMKADGKEPPIPPRGQEIRFDQTWSVYKGEAASSTIVTLDTTA